MLKWIGDTKGVEQLFGIPARDLTAEEVKQYGGETFLLATGLWTKVDAPKKEASYERK